MARYATPLPLPTVAPTTNSTTTNTPPRQDTDDGKFKIISILQINIRTFPFQIKKLLTV